MTANRTMKHTLIAGIGLIVFSNTVALSGVYYNRSGKPESTIMLSEREFTIPYRSVSRKENSGVALGLKWKTFHKRKKDTPYYYYSSQPPEWLNEKKLEELGFEVSHHKELFNKKTGYRRILPRQVLLVVELNGTAYQQDLKNASEHLSELRKLARNNPGKKEFSERLKTEQQHFERLQHKDSRLYVVDAGMDAGRLREKYSDTSRYFIAGGRVRAWIHSDRDTKQAIVTGYIAGLNVAQINVPKSLHADLEKVRADKSQRDSSAAPAYLLKVSWGNRLEPWLQSIEPAGD